MTFWIKESNKLVLLEGTPDPPVLKSITYETFQIVQSWITQQKLSFSLISKPISHFFTLFFTWLTGHFFHPSHSKRSFIKAKLLRYVRLTSKQSDFLIIRNKFLTIYEIEVILVNFFQIFFLKFSTVHVKGIYLDLKIRSRTWTTEYFSRRVRTHFFKHPLKKLIFTSPRQ